MQGGGSTEKTRMELWYSNVMSEIRVIVYQLSYLTLNKGFMVTI